MIIQCEKCQTRFRLDDSRVTGNGVKVRCTKCKHVFTVHKDEPEVESLPPGGALIDFSPPADHVDEHSATTENVSLAEESAAIPPVADSFAFEDVPVNNESALLTPSESSPFETSQITFDTEEDTFQISGSIQAAVPVTESTVVSGEVDFSDFDFGDSNSETESAPQTSSGDLFTEATPEAPFKETPQGLDFSDDDMFGAVVKAAPEASIDTISFDFEGDSFAESMDINAASNSKTGTTFALDSIGDTPFNLGEIDFGDELTSVAVQQVNPDDLKPSQEILFAPLAEAKLPPADNQLTQEFLQQSVPEQELPPLSIASRRKQSPLFGALIAVAALLVISVLGYFGYSSFSTPKESAAPESATISVRAVKSAFVENAVAGELLVVSGEAFNEYSKPRAALQVMVTVYDASGNIVATKSAYGGNPLSDEQLENLPLDKIEAAMANQFGDSLANMEVAHGKSINFVVVLANLPAGAKDFSVKSAGSTVATGKQQ